MNIIFVSFQGVKKGSPVGMVKLFLKLVLDSEKVSIYYVSFCGKEFDKLKMVGYVHFFLLRCLGFINRIFSSFGIYGTVRYLQEKSFDFFLSNKKYPVKLVSTTYIPLTFKKNKDRGGVNILIAGNPCEEYIANLYSLENDRHGVVINDVYTNKYRRILAKKTVQLSDLIIAQSEEVYRSYKEVYGKSLKIKLFKMDVPCKYISRVKCSEKKLGVTFCYLAHSVWLKGLTDLIEAWDSVVDSRATLIIGGEISPEVNKFLKENYEMMDPRIKFVGKVAPEKVNEFFSCSDVAVVPSLSDNHPTTISESLACGLPVICTEGCGSKGIVINGKTGFIVPIRSPKSLAIKMNWFIENAIEIPVFSKRISLTNAIDSRNKLMDLIYDFGENVD